MQPLGRGRPAAVPAAFGDGSVRVVRLDLPAVQWRAAVTAAGGEVIDFDARDPAPAAGATSRLVAPDDTRADAANAERRLKQVGLAFHEFATQTSDMLVPAAAIRDPAGKPLLSWRVALLPLVGRAGLYKKFKLDEPWDGDHNKKVLAANPMPDVYALPGVTMPGDTVTHLQAFVGSGAALELAAPTRLTDYTDGLSNTLLAAYAADAVEWTRPADIAFDPKADLRPKLLGGKGGRNRALFADGHVVLLGATLTAADLRALVTRAGGDISKLD